MLDASAGCSRTCRRCCSSSTLTFLSQQNQTSGQYRTVDSRRATVVDRVEQRRIHLMERYGLQLRNYHAGSSLPHQKHQTYSQTLTQCRRHTTQPFELQRIHMAKIGSSQRIRTASSSTGRRTSTMSRLYKHIMSQSVILHFHPMITNL